MQNLSEKDREFLENLKKQSKESEKLSEEELQAYQQSLLNNEAKDRILQDFIKSVLHALHQKKATPTAQAYELMEMLKKPYALMVLQQKKFPSFLRNYCINELSLIENLNASAPSLSPNLQTDQSLVEPSQQLKERLSFLSLLYNFCSLLADFSLPVTQLLPQNDIKWNVRVGTEGMEGILKSPFVDLYLKYNIGYLLMWLRMNIQLSNYFMIMYAQNEDVNLLDKAETYMNDALNKLKEAYKKPSNQALALPKEEYNKQYYYIVLQKAMIQKRKKNFEQAIKLMNELFKVKDKDAEPTSCASIHINIGNAYLEKAAETQKTHQIPYIVDFMNCSQDLSKISLDDVNHVLNEIEMGVKEFISGISIMEKHNSRDSYSISLINYAYALLMKFKGLLLKKLIMNDKDSLKNELQTHYEKMLSIFQKAKTLIPAVRVADSARMNIYWGETFVYKYALDLLLCNRNESEQRIQTLEQATECFQNAALVYTKQQISVRLWYQRIQIYLFLIYTEKGKLAKNDEEKKKFENNATSFKQNAKSITSEESNQYSKY